MTEHNILMEMSEKIGQIHGTLSAMDKKHTEFMACITHHGERISELEKTKHKAHGYLLGISSISAGIGAFVSHMWGK